MTRLKTEELERRLVEGHKLTYDLFKHLTTLSSGSVVLIVTMLEKAFPNPAQKWLVLVALIAFLICAVASVAAMVVSAMTLDPRAVRDNEGWAAPIGVTAVLTAGLCFVTAIACMVSFFFCNM